MQEEEKKRREWTRITGYLYFQSLKTLRIIYSGNDNG